MEPKKEETALNERDEALKKRILDSMLSKHRVNLKIAQRLTKDILEVDLPRVENSWLKLGFFNQPSSKSLYMKKNYTIDNLIFQ